MKTILDREREKKTGEAATGGEGDAAAEDGGFMHGRAHVECVG